MKHPTLLFVLLVLVTSARSSAADSLPQPGPEDGGLRLRLIVTPREDAQAPGYDVRLDLLNVSDRDLTLHAKWRHDGDRGDVAEYIETAASIESVPAIAPWIGGVQEGQRTSPQPQKVLKAGEVLSATWKSPARRLKNRVTNPNEVQNPEFPFPGLYSVHATLDVITGEGTVRLRSNEQLVSVGGSQKMPKYTRGQLWHVNNEKKTAMIGLGSLHKVAVGDQFEIGHPKGKHWKLTITDVEPRYSTGNLELLTRSPYPPYSEPPTQYHDATLVLPK
jgi:hypothetical protein